MTTRDRTLAVAVLGALVVMFVGVFMVYQLYLTPLRQREAAVQLLQKDILTRQDRIDQITAALPKLERWQKISLPPDEDTARREYSKWLGELLRTSGYREMPTIVSKPGDSKSSPQLPGKKPIYTTLTFTVLQSRANLETLVRTLEGFSKAPLLHRIKTLTIKKPETMRGDQRPDDLDIDLTIEALIVNGIKPRDRLLPDDKSVQDPQRLAAAKRDYASIAAKNIFLGPAPPSTDPSASTVDITPFVFLTDVTHTGTEGFSYKKSEGMLYDRYNNLNTRLAARPGFDSFRVKDDKDKVLIQGRVLRIEERAILFEVEADDSVYALRVGQSLGEALDKPVATKKMLGQVFGQLAFPGLP